MKKILIPTDFSGNAKDAFFYAIKLIANREAIINVVHVIPQVFIHSADGTIVDTSVAERVKDVAEKNMTILLKTAERFFKRNIKENIRLKTDVITGEIIASIKKQAKDINADLIVMGTMGAKHNVLEKILGTISTSIVNNTPCPVLLVPLNYAYKKIKNLVFATNLETGDPYEFDRAIKLIEAQNSAVLFVHVSKIHEKKLNSSQDKLAQYMIEQTPSTKSEFITLSGNNPIKIILEKAISTNAELIIMHKSTKNLYQKVFGRKHVKEMINLMQTPVLVMN